MQSKINYVGILNLRLKFLSMTNKNFEITFYNEFTQFGENINIHAVRKSNYINLFTHSKVGNYYNSIGCDF